MFEYKVLDCKSPKEAEAKMNELARDGWKVISIIPWAAATARIAVTLEKTVN